VADTDAHVSVLLFVVFTNIFTLIAMTITTLLSGDLLGMIVFARNNAVLCHYIWIYTFVAYIAISIHMNVVRRFGGVAAVLLATGRKGMTLVLSFVLFPKAFSWYYVMGAILVLGGLLFSSLVKIREKSKRTQGRKSEETASPVIGENYRDHHHDIEHHGSSNMKPVSVSSSGDGNSNLEMIHGHDTSSPSHRENGLFGRISAHDHQQ
jgi:adenosine 3'-phospho 5'-phosphosulfate transporter B3